MTPASTQSILPRTWEIPASIRERVGRSAGPQRSIFEEGHLLIILNLPPSADQSEREPAFFWRNPQGTWSVHGTKGPGLAGLHQLTAQYDTTLDELDAREQKAATAHEYHEILESISPLLRASRGLHRALQQAREFVKADRDLINLRDESAALERTAELLLQDAQHGLNFIAAKQSEEQAKAAERMSVTAHRLNILAAIFLPLSTLASIFSMEVHSGVPNTPQSWAMLVFAGTGLGIALSLAIARRK